MSDDSDRMDPAGAPATGLRVRRSANSLEPAERAQKRSPRRDAPPEVDEPGGPSVRPGDLPQSLARRYVTEALRGGSILALYEGPGAKRVALKDHGHRLTTDQSHPAIARDMALIAAHRGWTTVRVRGQDEFRREVWLQARALGLEVQGYKPRERDQQELTRMSAGPGRRPPAPERPATIPPPEDRNLDAKVPQARDKPGYALGVTGVLLEVGEAPYRRRDGAPVTPFIRLQRERGRVLDVWGGGLPQALQRSGARVGDRLEVRRDGVEVVRKTITVRDPKTGRKTAQVRAVSRNVWVITAERFREATPAQAARDPDLRGAQSHLTVLNSVIDQSVRDPKAREALRAEARGLVADELAQGRRFTPARVREIEPVLARDAAAAQSRETASERAHRR